MILNAIPRGAPLARAPFLTAGRPLRAGLVALALALAPTAASAQGFGGGRGFGGPGGEVERQLVAQFDRNGDERLDATERAAARASLGANAGGRGGFGGRGGGRGIAPGTPGASITPAQVRRYGSEPLYDDGTLRTIFIQFESADWESELAAFYNTDVEVPATVSVDGVTYRDVGVHFRGASSFRMVPEGSKRSLNLAFDFVNEEQRIGGYRTLNLLNANSDPTFVRGVLYSAIAREYIPAPKVNFVRVAINGESWGIYLSAQQFNKDFLRDFYDTDEGARWKVPGSPNGRGGMEYLGEDVAAYRRLYEIKTKDDPKSWADLIALFRVLHQTPPERLDAALAPILDVDGVLRFLALEVALANSDGYWTRASDYDIYQGVDGRFHVIPHDMNEGLGVGGRAPEPLVAVDDPSKPLRSKLLAVPALRERYLGYVHDIADRWMDWERVGPIVERYQSLIADDVGADTRKLYPTDQFRSGTDALRGFLEQRRAYLLR